MSWENKAMVTLFIRRHGRRKREGSLAFRAGFIALFCTWTFLGTRHVEAEEPRETRWEELAPAKVTDPYQKLSSDQIGDLAFVSRIRSLVVAGKVEQDGETAKEAMAIEQRLQKSGVDVGYLLSMRQQVQRLRESQGRAVQTSLDGKSVRLTGYVVPLTSEGGLVRDFLVVPAADSCSDAKLPVANQAVHVRWQDGILARGGQSAVRVTGKLETEPSTCLIARKWGTARVTVGYTLTPSQIEVYSSDREGQTQTYSAGSPVRSSSAGGRTEPADSARR